MLITYEDDEHRSDEGLPYRNTNQNRPRTGTGAAAIHARRRFGVRPQHHEFHPRTELYCETVCTGYFDDAPRGHWLNRQIEQLRDSD